MRRRLLLAVASGTLVLGACSDQTQSPTEPTVPPPAQNFGSCQVARFPLLDVARQIRKIYPSGPLRTEALLRAAAVALLWDTCHPDGARRAAFSFIDWLNRHTPAGKEDQVKALILTILRGIGEVTAPESSGDFGVGFFDPANPNNTLITTVNGRALVELEPGSFLVPTVISISREAGDPPLTNFEGRQFPPTYDYNAINSTNDHVIQPGKTAIVAFCLLFLDDVVFPGGYPADRRIGHNPVAGAPGFPFEILDPVDLVAAGLRDDLNCPEGTLPDPGLSSSGGGLQDLADAALRTAGSYLLPPPLWAAALGTLPPPPPLGGRAPSLSPFKVVEVSTSAGTISNGTITLGVNPTGNLIVFEAGTPSSQVGTTDVGLRFVPTNAEALATGILSEGWGVAHGTSEPTGYANLADEGSPVNLTVESFTRTATQALSVVRVGSALRVTHNFHPSVTSPNLYEIGVKIENLTSGALAGVVYRRVMDWDIEPTRTDEFVTIVGAEGTPGVSATNNGFASANPFEAKGAIPGGGSDGIADFFNVGPFDHGAVFDLTLPTIFPGGDNSFVLYYGAAASALAAKTAAASIGAEVVSLARPNVEPLDGTPNTFLAAFGGLGGTPLTVADMEPAPTGGGGILGLVAPVLPAAQSDPQTQAKVEANAEP